MYKRQAERSIKDAQWKALEFRALDVRLQGLREKLLREETQLEQVIAEQREAERELETGRERRETASDTLNAAQAGVYQVGSTLARVEQQIAHQQELSVRLQRARDEAQSALAELGQHISGDAQKLDVLRETLAEAEPQLELLQEADLLRQDALHEVEGRLADWQTRWETHTREQSEASRAGEVERTRIEQLDRQIFDADRRRSQLHDERIGLDLVSLSDAFAQLELEHETRKESLEALTEQVELRKHASGELQEQQRSAQTELAELRKHAQSARGRLASLETLQHAALGQEQGLSLIHI